MPESVFTQTMPLPLAGGVCCCAVGLGVEDAEELDGVGIARGVGSVTGGGVELLRLDAAVGAGALAGVELVAGVLAVEASCDRDFSERDFLGALGSAAPS